jgi:Tol biopolymer transport system component
MQAMSGSQRSTRIDRALVPVLFAFLLPLTPPLDVHQRTRGDLRQLPPTSETIAFVSRNGIWLVEADGSSLRRLTTHRIDRSPVWSPDGGAVAFLRETSKGLGQLRTIGADGSDEHVLIEKWQGDEPTWSPDGSKFAYYCQCDGSVHVMNADGSDDVTIAGSHATRAPAWSPGGSRIAYGAPVDRRFRIFIVNPDGTDPTQVTRGSGSDAWPAWSSDGTRILFSRWHRGDGWDLYVVVIKTSTVLRMTRTPNLNEIEASWSPDGSQVAFIGFRAGARRSFLYIVSGTGSGRRRLVDRPATQSAWRPLWSVIQSPPHTSLRPSGYDSWHG